MATGHRNANQKGAPRVTFELGADVVPGTSRVEVDVGNGNTVIVQVPCEARAYDTLVLEKGADGTWCGSILRHGHDGQRGWLAEIPPDAIPGVSQVHLLVDDHRRLVVTMPRDAMAGDQLRLQQDSPGQYRCTVEQRRHPHVRQGSISRHVLRIPLDAVPGRTVLSADVGCALPVDVLIPTSALPGDRLVLTMNASSNAWIVQTLRSIVPISASLSLPEVASDIHTTFTNMVACVRCAGGFVSPKVKRGVTPPVCIPGMIACEGISMGEEIVSVPSRFHLSFKNCERVFSNLVHEASTFFFKSNTQEVILSICIAILIGQAMARESDLPTTMTSFESDEGDVLTVWKNYAEVLVSESFGRHPYVRAYLDPKAVASMMEPSTQHAHFQKAAEDLKESYNLISRSLRKELLGEDFTIGAYFQARLCMLTRVFGWDSQSILVPICDFFNHHPNPGVVWAFDEDTQVMSLKTTRDHAPGEELFISYGARSNELLFRTYGFTLPPEVEPSWGFVCQGCQIPKHISSQYLPQALEAMTIQLDTTDVHDSLVTSLNACVSHGSSAELFLYSLCHDFIITYENDSSLTPALEALERARRKEPSLGDWWGEFSQEDMHKCHKDGYGDWTQEVINLKMSEYLCLKSHLEVFDYMNGEISEGQCLARARNIRKILLNAFPLLRAGEEISLRSITR